MRASLPHIRIDLSHDRVESKSTSHHKDKDSTFKAVWKIMAMPGFMGLHLASCGVRAFFVIWQRAAMSSHHGCPADGLLCREMSREQAFSLSLSCSLSPSISLAPRAPSLLHVLGLLHLVSELWQWELCGRRVGRVGPRCRSPSQACATGKSASSRSAEYTRSLWWESATAECAGGKTYTSWCCPELARGPFAAACGFSQQSSHRWAAHPSPTFG